MRMFIVGAIFAATACSSGSSQSCDSVYDELEAYARKPHPPNYPHGYDGNGDGKPDATGICNASDPTIRNDVANLCAQARACQ